MGELTTSRKLLPYPKPQGLVSAGPADFRELGEAWEGADEGWGDSMYPGLCPEAGGKLLNWKKVEPLTVSAAGLVSSTGAFGGKAYVPDPGKPGALVLINTFGGPSPTNLSFLTPTAPAVLPQVGFQLIAVLEMEANGWDRPPKYLLTNCGTEKKIGTGNATPELLPTRLPLAWVQIKNEGGVYVASGTFTYEYFNTPVNGISLQASSVKAASIPELGEDFPVNFAARPSQSRWSDMYITAKTSAAAATIGIYVGTTAGYLSGEVAQRQIVQELTIPEVGENEGRLDTQVTVPAGMYWGWQKLSGGPVTVERGKLVH